MEHKRDDEKSTHEHERRHSDPLLNELRDEVRGFRQDMQPIRKFMEDVDAAKKAAIWTLGVLSAMGAAIKFVWDFKDHIHKGNG